jgi:spore coat protein U-like protein
MRYLLPWSLIVIISTVVVLNLAHAGSVTAVLPVIVTVVPQCVVSANGIDFGTWSSQVVTGKGTIDVTCAKGVDYQVVLSAGANFDPATQARQLAGPNPTQKLSYRLYQDAGLNIEWGDRGYANTYPAGSGMRGIGTNQAQHIVVYGMIPASPEHLPPGSYSDTALVTIHF